MAPLPERLANHHHRKIHGNMFPCEGSGSNPILAWLMFHEKWSAHTGTCLIRKRFHNPALWLGRNSHVPRPVYIRIPILNHEFAQGPPGPVFFHFQNLRNKSSLSSLCSTAHLEACKVTHPVRWHFVRPCPCALTKLLERDIERQRPLEFPQCSLLQRPDHLPKSLGELLAGDDRRDLLSGSGELERRQGARWLRDYSGH
jgi:hypothetical protein